MSTIKMTIKQRRDALAEALPRAISILGREFSVAVTNLKHLHGDMDDDKSLIRIHQNLSIEEARTTLFHEAVHAAFFVSGHKEMLKEEQEEAIVRMIEHAFYKIVEVEKLAVDKT